jgi:uncharacterized protein (AIM24 family)
MWERSLHYRVEQVTREEEKLARAVEIVLTTGGSGIVYTSTVAAAATAAGLRAKLLTLRHSGAMTQGEPTHAQLA